MRGRPKATQTIEERRQSLTLDNYPTWLSYKDVQALLRLYQGKGYGSEAWNHLVATKKIPAHFDPWGGHIRFKWEEVRTAIENARRLL